MTSELDEKVLIELSKMASELTLSIQETTELVRKVIEYVEIAKENLKNDKIQND